MDDDDNGLYFAPDLAGGRAASAGLQCERCGSSACMSDDLGNIVCLDCGTQSQDVRNLEGEYDGGGGLVRTRGGAAVVRRTKRGPRASLPNTRDAFSTQALLGALQHIIDAQVTALVRMCGCSPGLRDAAARVWFGYLERWAAAPSAPPPAVIVVGHVASGAQQAYWAALRSAGHTGPPRCVPLSMGLLLCVCYAAARLEGAPVLPHDLCAWVRNGTLPFLDAYSGLPLPVQATVALARSMLSPTGPPSPLWLVRMTDLLCVNVGVTLPPVNFAACAARLVNLTRLPASAVPLAVAFCALDDADRSRQREGPRSRDPLEVLRRAACSDLPGAYVAAVVATAVRLTRSWREWVDKHLQPYSGADRPQVAACSVGPWAAGSNFDEPMIHAGTTSPTPPFVPHPDVALPWTTAQTHATPAKLAVSYARFAGARILHGGDALRGRGEEGYERGRYGARATTNVTIASGREAEELELRAAARTPAGAAVAAAAAAQAQDAATGSLMALLMEGEGSDDVTAAEAAAAASGPRDLRVALGARKGLLSTRLGGVLWRQGHLYDVAELSAGIRAWGEAGAEERAAVDAGHGPRTQPAQAAPPITAGESGVALASSITVFAPIAVLREADALANSSTPPGDEHYNALLELLCAATDSSLQAVAAHADAILLLLEYIDPRNLSLPAACKGMII